MRSLDRSRRLVALVGGPCDGETLFLSRRACPFGQLVPDGKVAIYRRGIRPDARSLFRYHFCGLLPDRPP